MAQLVEHHLTKRKVAYSIPSQGTCWGCETSPQLGHKQEATDRCLSHISTFLSLSFSLPSPLSKYNYLKKPQIVLKTGKRFEQTLHQKYMNGNKYMQRHSVSLNIRDMQIETTM